MTDVCATMCVTHLACRSVSVTALMLPPLDSIGLPLTASLLILNSTKAAMQMICNHLHAVSAAATQIQVRRHLVFPLALATMRFELSILKGVNHGAIVISEFEFE